MKKILIALTVVLTFAFIVFYNYYNKNVNNMKKEIYLEKSTELKNELKRLIIKKQGDTSALTYVLSQDNHINEALIQNDNRLVNFTKIINGLKTVSEFKNIWIQIIDKNGDSFIEVGPQKQGIIFHL